MNSIPEEKIELTTLNKANNIQFSVIVSLYDEAPNDSDKVMLTVVIDGKEYSFCEECYFYALTSLRRFLESKSLQLLCNGAAKEVYPSPMMMSMGGTNGYILKMKQPARLKDVVDLFEYDSSLTPATVDEQEQYYKDWLSSLG